MVGGKEKEEEEEEEKNSDTYGDGSTRQEQHGQDGDGLHGLGVAHRRFGDALRVLRDLEVGARRLERDCLVALDREVEYL